MSARNVDDIRIAKRINELRLDKQKCPVLKLNELMDLLKTEVDFILISAKRSFQNVLTYLVEAKSNGMTVNGSSNKSVFDAKKNAAFNLFEKLSNRYRMPSISNAVCTNKSEINENAAEDIIYINNYVGNSLQATTLHNSYSPELIKEPTQTNFNITSVSDGSSNWSPGKYKTADNCYDSTSSTPLAHPPLSGVTKNSVAKHTTMNCIGLLQEKCLRRDWKLPKYDVIKIGYGVNGYPEYTANCQLLSHHTQGEGVSEQTAMKQAANKMYELIHTLYGEDLKIVPEDITPYNYLFSDIQYLHSKKFISANTLQDLKTFFEQWNSCQGSQSMNKSKREAVNILGKIAKAESITVKYIVVLQSADKTEVLAQISTNPIAVHMGQGSTMNKALGEAAFATLSYLQAKFNGTM